MKLLIYSHDAYGLGNIRRMLAICDHLLNTVNHLSILLISGSPLLHSFRLPHRLDYIKLPCIRRDEQGKLSAKYLQEEADITLRLRSELICSTALAFQPDLILVDKKPYGLGQELLPTLQALRQHSPRTRCLLLLRDILDAPSRTLEEWQDQDTYGAIRSYYDQVLVVGCPQIFDLCREYQIPQDLQSKIRYCGYIRKPKSSIRSLQIREQLGIPPDQIMVAVTPGGGEDGFLLLNTYLQAIRQTSLGSSLHSLVIQGPDLPAAQRSRITALIQNQTQVQGLEFTEDPMAYWEAADLIVSMAGYNTISEILSLRKRAVVVPRIKPGVEQLIRADRMAALGLLRFIHPDQLTPESLIKTVENTLKQDPPVINLDMNGLPRIRDSILSLHSPSESSDLALLPTAYQPLPA